MHLLKKDTEIKKFCLQARNERFIAIDTEFMRSRTYWAKLCLIQIATSKKAVIIDALTGVKHLEPVKRLLIDPKILKVFHGARQDLEVIYHSFGKIPKSIFYFGTLSDAKGVDRLAKIFNKVHEKFSEASLHIIGKNENYFNNLKTEVIAKNAKSNVNYYGHISLLDLPKHIAKAALVIVPSKGETFGFTIVEAMALQKVTIVSNIPVAKEIITHQEDGYIANTDKDFINHISEVFQNPEAFSQMEKKAREKVIKNFSQELMVNNSFKYYEEILAEKK